MDWSMWGSCSVTCGVGEMTRQRQCLNPRPEHGGRSCTGNSLEHKTCHPGQCTGITHSHLKIRRALYTYCVKFVQTCGILNQFTTILMYTPRKRRIYTKQFWFTL